MKNTTIITAVFTLVTLLIIPVLSAHAEEVDKAVKKNYQQNPQYKMQRDLNQDEGNNNQSPMSKPRGGKPPQEAINICLSKSENSSCSFQGPKTAENGFCEFTPDKQYFACNPTRNQRKKPRQAQPTIPKSQIKQLPSHLAPNKINN